jgi:hypothetical protein
MTNHNNSNDKGQMNISPPVEPAQEKDIVASRTRKMVAQCSALLRQRLERKVKQEPEKYDQQYIDRFMRGFQAGAQDVEAAILQRVKSRLFSVIQEEILRVMDDALNDGLGYGYSTENESSTKVSFNVVKEKTRQHQEQPPVQHTPVIPIAEEVPAKRLVQEESVEPKAQLQARKPESAVSVVKSQESDVKVMQPSIQAVVAGDPAKEQASEPTPPEEIPEEKGVVDNEIFEGTVKLRVEPNGSVKQLVYFVEALRRKTDLRLLQLVGNRHERAEIWLGLRAPLPLKQVLMQMEGVLHVESTLSKDMKNGERMLNVQLVEVSLSHEQR